MTPLTGVGRGQKAAGVQGTWLRKSGSCGRGAAPAATPTSARRLDGKDLAERQGPTREEVREDE
jgi:hypothetical protein